MSHRYFTLLAREDDRSTWAIEFGDYDRSTVQDEFEYYLDQGYHRSALKIITTQDDQASIDAAVARMNGWRN